MAKGSGTMLKGMTNKSPSATDASTKPKGGSVDSDATRTSVASGHTLGPRNA